MRFPTPFLEDGSRGQGATLPQADVSPEWPLEYLPTPFEFELAPGMGRVMVTAEPRR